MGTVRGHKKERAAERHGPQTPDVVAATAGTGRGDGGSVPSPRERLRSREMTVKVFVAGVTFVALFRINRSAAVVGAMLAPVVSELVTDYVERHRWSLRRLRRGSAAVAVIGEEEKAYAARRRGGGTAGGGGGLPGALFAGLAAMALVGGGIFISQHIGGGHPSAVGPTGSTNTGPTTRLPGPPGHVIGLAGATPTAAPPFITWHAVPGAAHYAVRRNGRLVARPTTNSFNDRRAPHGTLTYRVTAMAHGVAGLPSTRHTIVYQAEAPPQAGINLTPTSGPNDPPSFSWDQVSQAETYAIYRDGEPIGEIGAAEPTYTDRDVDPGTYDYRVAWIHGRVESLPSPPVRILYQPVVHPVEAPTGLRGSSPTPAQPELRWTPVDVAHGYTVYRGGTPVGNPTKPFFRDDTAEAGTLTYFVTATVDGVESGHSSSIEIRFVPPLPPPAGVAGPGTFTSLPIVLTWYRVDGAEGYVVYRDGVPLPETRGTTFKDADASLADHTYTVATVNTIGAVGEQSARVPVTYEPPAVVS